MTEYGLTATGFNRKPLLVIVEDLQARLNALFGEELDWTAGSPLRVIVDGLALEYAKLWEEAERVYWANKVSGATGVGLDDLVAFQRITRMPAAKASGIVTFYGDTGAKVAAGDRVAASSTGLKYVVLDDAEITAGGQVDAWVEAEETGPAYNCVAGVIDTLVDAESGIDSVSNIDQLSVLQIARVANDGIEIAADGALTSYQTVMKADIAHPHNVTAVSLLLENPVAEQRTVNIHLAFVNDATTVPLAITHTKEVIFDASEQQWVTFSNLEIGISVMSDKFRVALVNEETSGGAINWLANNTDPYSSGDLYEAGVKQVGFDGLLYLSSETIGAFIDGRDIESDTELALRFLAAKGRGATAIPEAIIADLWAIDGVRSVSFRQNREDVEVDGLARRSIEATILGGDTDEIAKALLRIVAAGIKTEGNVAELVNDDYGQGHTVRFNRPEQVMVYCDLSIRRNAAFSAETGDELVRDAVITYIGGRDTSGAIQSGLNAGESVVVARIIDAVMSVPGVEDVSVKLGFTADPTGTSNLELEAAQKAVTDVDHVGVGVMS